MRICLVLALVLLTQILHGQKWTLEDEMYFKRIRDDTLITLAHFSTLPFPSVYDFKFSANADTTWTVDRNNGGLYANIGNNKLADSAFPKSMIPLFYNILSGERSILKVDDGYLVGVFRGEWGGALFWFSFDGKRHYLISNTEIVQFIVRDNMVYAIEGLAHLHMSKGSVILIQKVKGEWSISPYLTLPSAPYGIGLAPDGRFIVITTKGLLRVDANKEISYLIINDGIGYHYPTSLIIENQIVYVGMRAGVMTYSLSSGDVGWLHFR